MNDSYHDKTKFKEILAKTRIRTVISSLNRGIFYWVISTGNNFTEKKIPVEWYN